MRDAVDQLIDLIQFAGVAVAFVGVVVTVVRAAVASLGGGRSRRVTDIGLDLARTVLVGIDLLLVAAILQVAITANEITFRNLATVAGLRIGVTLLIAFEDAFRADAVGTRADTARSWSRALGRPRVRRSRGPLLARSDAPVENVWPDRARLGREGDWHRSAG
ncbi:MAG: hypothetical protein LC792_26590 [Actinobacteria bacterium]|nr:hypothetical protein [Actinomycetota bacterium]